MSTSTTEGTAARAPAPTPSTTAPARSARRPAGSSSRCAATTGRRASAATATTSSRRGFICPKGSALKQLHDDPDRLRRPLRRGATATLRRGRPGTRRSPRSRPGCAPSSPSTAATPSPSTSATRRAHPGRTLYAAPLIKALGTTNVFSASTVDQMPKQVSCGLHVRRRRLLDPGARRRPHRPPADPRRQPAASNGSLCTAPDLRGRLEAIRERGGKVVVVDPRRTRTAEDADEHLPSAPAPTRTCCWRSPTCCSPRASSTSARLRRARRRPRRARGRWSRRSRPRRSPPSPASTPTTSAASRASSPPRRTGRASTAASAPTPQSSARSRAGSSTSSTCSPATSTGRAARCSPPPAPRPAGRGPRGKRPGLRHRALAQPGARAPGGLRRAAGRRPRRGDRDPGRGPGPRAGHGRRQPGRSRPRTRPRSTRRSPALDFMVARRHLRQRDHPPRRRDPAAAVAARTRPLRPRALPARRAQRRQLLAAAAARCRPAAQEWEILGSPRPDRRRAGAAADPDALDDLLVARGRARRAVAAPGSPVAGRDVGRDPATAPSARRRGPRAPARPHAARRPLRRRLRRRARRARPSTRWRRSPHGVDLGPLEPRLPEVLRTPSRARSSCAPAPIVADVDRLAASLDGRRATPDALVLIGRRHLRSNNSWMHNLDVLVKGKHRCTLHVHPDDAARLGLADGADAEVALAGRRGRRPGRGHRRDQPGRRVAPARLGPRPPRRAVRRRRPARPASTPTCSPTTTAIDPLSGNAVLNGIPVTVSPSSPAS